MALHKAGSASEQCGTLALPLRRVSYGAAEVMPRFGPQRSTGTQPASRKWSAGAVSCLLPSAGPCQHQPGALSSRGSATRKEGDLSPSAVACAGSTRPSREGASPALGSSPCEPQSKESLQGISRGKRKAWIQPCNSGACSPLLSIDRSHQETPTLPSGALHPIPAEQQQVLVHY